MTEDQAIERITAALAECNWYKSDADAALIAWNEIKAIAREDVAERRKPACTVIRPLSDYDRYMQAKVLEAHLSDAKRGTAATSASAILRT